jgi:hypothetical protein
MIGLGYFYLRRRPDPSQPLDRDGVLDSGGWGLRLLAAIFCVVLLCAIGSFLFISLRTPHGNYDAVSIWNLRARFLVRDTTDWKHAFTDSISITHPDYPLLVSSTVTRLWKQIGSETVLAPMAAAFFFTFSTVGLVCSSLAFLRNKEIGYLGGIVLLGASSFVSLGAAQYADTAVSMFILSTLILMALYDASPENDSMRLLVLAGASAGFCAWTKNEGQLFLVLVLSVRFVSSLLTKGWKPAVREEAAMIVGALPAFAALAYFRFAVIPSNFYLVSGSTTAGPMQYFLQSGSISQKVLQASRYRLIAKTMAIQILQFGGGAIGLTPFLALYFLLARVKRSSFSTVQIGVSLLILMLAGYFAVYLTTPLDLAFQLDTSLSRLLLQLWPGAVFVFFMMTSTAGFGSTKVQSKVSA